MRIRELADRAAARRRAKGCAGGGRMRRRHPGGGGPRFPGTLDKLRLCRQGGEQELGADPGVVQPRHAAGWKAAGCEAVGGCGRSVAAVALGASRCPAMPGISDRLRLCRQGGGRILARIRELADRAAARRKTAGCEGGGRMRRRRSASEGCGARSIAAARSPRWRRQDRAAGRVMRELVWLAAASASRRRDSAGEGGAPSGLEIDPGGAARRRGTPAWANRQGGRIGGSIRQNRPPVARRADSQAVKWARIAADAGAGGY